MRFVASLLPFSSQPLLSVGRCPFFSLYYFSPDWANLHSFNKDFVYDYVSFAMAATKLINLLALLTIAVLACSFNATPANAITIHGGVLPHGPHSHGTAAKRRLQARQVKNRANTKRCKPRPSSALGSPAPASTSQAAAAAPTSEAAVSITIVAPPPITTTIVDHSPVTQKAADPTPVYTPPSNGGGSGGKVGIAWNNPDTQSLRNLKQGQVSM
jgi:hypothetical protein